MSTYFGNVSFLPVQPPRRIRVGISPWANMKYRCIPSSKGCKPGLELEILEILSKILNFEMDFKVSNATGCGTKLADGNWTGMFEWLQSDKIDIIGNVCNIDESRLTEPWMESSYPVLQYSQSFLIKAHEPKFQFVLFGPFRPQVWLLLVAISMFFATLRSLFTVITSKVHWKKAFLETFWGMFNVSLGMTYKDTTVPWLMWTCVCGFVVVIYASFVQVSLMNVVNVYRPFVNHLEFADKLYTGEYRLVDYKKPPSTVQCTLDAVCNKILRAQDIHKYDYFSQSTQYTHDDHLLSHVSKHDKAVFVNGEIWTRLLLQNFAAREKLWIMEDDAATLRMSAFFYRSDFALKPLLNQALLMGSFEENVVKRYIGFSYMGTINKKIIRGEIPKKIHITWVIFQRPFMYYIIFSLFTCLWLVFEVIYHKFQIKKIVENIQARSNYCCKKNVEISPSCN